MRRAKQFSLPGRLACNQTGATTEIWLCGAEILTELRS
jgi:hypothetical protein